MNRLQQVIDTMLLNIEQQLWATNCKIPSERILVTQLHASRAIIREAIATLKQRGILRSVQGSGHFVQSSNTDKQADLISWNNVEMTHEELREYRFAIEAQCAYLAALRADSEQLKAIERAHRHLKHVQKSNDLKAEGLADARFHLAIAEASGNRILSQSLTDLFSLLRANVTKNIGTLSRRPETRLRLMKQHTALFESIFYRKPEKAREIAQDHMAFVERILTDH